MGVLRRLNRYGDTEMRWEAGDVKSLQDARLTFASHIKDGGLAFEVDSPSGDATVVRKFNSKAEEIILAPRLMGG